MLKKNELTPREQEVFELLMQGLGNREIASNHAFPSRLLRNTSAKFSRITAKV